MCNLIAYWRVLYAYGAKIWPIYFTDKSVASVKLWFGRSYFAYTKLGIKLCDELRWLFSYFGRIYGLVGSAAYFSVMFLGSVVVMRS